MRGQVPNGGNVDAAKAVGKLIAERAKAAGIESVAFDRSGFHYHGRVRRRWPKPPARRRSQVLETDAING